MNSKIAQGTVFSLANHKIVDFEGTFFDLNSAPQSASKRTGSSLSETHAIDTRLALASSARLPGSPLAYWASPQLRTIFDE